MSKSIGELHAAFDDAIDRYAAFNNGPYDPVEHNRRTLDVLMTGQRLLEAFERAANSKPPQMPWVLRHR